MTNDVILSYTSSKVPSFSYQASQETKEIPLRLSSATVGCISVRKITNRSSKSLSVSKDRCPAAPGPRPTIVSEPFVLLFSQPALFTVSIRVPSALLIFTFKISELFCLLPAAPLLLPGSGSLTAQPPFHKLKLMRTCRQAKQQRYSLCP